MSQTPFNPCAAGCLLGLGSACANLPQPYRNNHLWHICRKIDAGDEAFRRQTIEHTEQGADRYAAEAPLTPAERRASKPRIALGVPQKRH